jgi:hypothetical protein
MPCKLLAWSYSSQFFLRLINIYPLGSTTWHLLAQIFLDLGVVVQKELCARHVVAMVEDMTFGPNIDGQGIMAFVDLQVHAKNHDRSNANEGEKVVAIKLECVEALVEVRGALISTWMMLSLNYHDSLQGVSWPFVCKLVHWFSRFATWGGYNYDLII